MGVACVATDISWVLCFHDLPSRYTEAEVEALVSDYFDELQALGGAPGSTLEALKEQVALAHLYTLGKAVIGTGGLANTDVHAKQIMHLLVSCMSLALLKRYSRYERYFNCVYDLRWYCTQNCGVLNNMEKDGSVRLFRKYLAGGCDFQK